MQGNGRNGGAKRPAAGAGHRYTMPKAPCASAPKCVVTVNFLSHWDSNKCRPDLERAQFAHYIVGEGKGDDGTLPEMFTADDDVPSAFAAAWLRRDQSLDSSEPGFNALETSPSKRWPLKQAWCADILRRDMPHEPRHFRLVVSPEELYGKQIELREFTRELMERVESDNFRRLYWVASEHHNTDHPHVHIGIRGLDTIGQPVHFAGPYANKGFRYRAREVLAEAFNVGKRVSRAG